LLHLAVDHHHDLDPLPEAGEPGVDAWDSVAGGRAPGGKTYLPPPPVLEACHRTTTIA